MNKARSRVLATMQLRYLQIYRGYEGRNSCEIGLQYYTMLHLKIKNKIKKIKPGGVYCNIVTFSLKPL